MTTETLERESRTTTPAHQPARRGNAPRRGGRRWITLAVMVLLVLVIAVGAVIATMSRREPEMTGMTFTVAQGPLTVSVTESGTIKAREQVIIKSEVEGNATILYLIPEGTEVKKGDLLAELDATKLQSDRIEEQIQVQNARAAFVGARENLEVVKNQAASDVSAAVLAYRFAQEDLDQYLEGIYPNEKMAAENKIAVAREDFQRAQDKLEWSKKLFEEKYLSQSELQADEIAAKKAELELQLAVDALRLLEQYTKPRQVATFESEIEQTEMALERARRKASADVVQAEADLEAKTLQLEQQEGQLARIEEQIRKAKIYAPADGLVVYATTGRGGWRGNDEPLQEGRTVREREDLIYLPKTNAVMAEIKVHESSLDKVRAGLPVRIAVDALPGSTFWGRVSRIAPLPDAQSSWMNPDLKVYNTEIIVSSDATALRTGMSCRAEIIVARYEDAVYTPVQSVIRVGGTPTAYVMQRDGQIEARPLEIGLDNNRMVRVIDGLKPGERVLLSPPLSDAAADDRFDDDPEDGVEGAAVAPSPAPRRAEQAPEAQQSPQAGAGEARGAGRGEGSGESRPRGEGAEGRPRGEGADAGESRRGQMPRGMENLTDEQREQMRQRFQNMSPEERQKLRQQFQQQQQQGGGGNG